MRLETQLLLLLAVATAAAAAAELLHLSNEFGQLSDIDYEDSHGVGPLEDQFITSRRHDLHKRAPKKKGFGFFKGFTVAKKSFAKGGKSLGGKGATALFT